MDSTSSSSLNNESSVNYYYNIIIITTFSFILLMTIPFCVYVIVKRFYINNLQERDPNTLNCFQKIILKCYSPRIRVYDLNHNELWVDPIPIKNLVQHFEIPNEDPDLECPICFEKIGPVKCHIGCSHAFHEECIKTWIINNNKTTCPICRNNVVVLVV